MPLYRKNIEKVLNSRESLERQKEDVPAGNYLVTRIFPPAQYPTATLCTPFFRVYLPKKAWKDVGNAVKKDMASPLYIAWDGQEYEIEQDSELIFGYSPYYKDQWGVRLEDTEMEDCYLSFEDFYAKAGELPPETNSDEKGQTPW